MTVPAPVLPGEEDGGACGRCGKPGALDITWCHAWQEWLCLVCRALATDAALRMTLADKQAIDARAREAS